MPGAVAFRGKSSRGLDFLTASNCAKFLAMQCPTFGDGR